MLAPWKKTIKSCLKPIYYRLPMPLLRAVRRWREGRGAAEGGVGAELPPDLLLEHLQESDRLLLAAVKMAQGGQGPPAPVGFSAVALGNDRLLAAHPRLPFAYLDARDLRQTPYIVAGRFEPAVARALERLVRPGAAVVEVGAGQGYHTLSLADLAGPGGRVVALEPDPAAFAVLNDNLTAHQLGHRVTALPSGPAALPELLAARRADLVRIDARTRLAEALEHLQPALERDAGLGVLFPFQPALGGEPLVRVAGPARRLWRLGEDGEAEEVSPRRLLDGPPHARIDVLAAAAFD